MRGRTPRTQREEGRKGGREEGRMDEDTRMYQDLIDEAMRNTCAIGKGRKEWEGTTQSAKVWAQRCLGSGVLIDGKWKEMRVQGVVTAGHVIQEMEKVEGEAGPDR